MIEQAILGEGGYLISTDDSVRHERVVFWQDLASVEGFCTSTVIDTPNATLV